MMKTLTLAAVAASALSACSSPVEEQCAQAKNPTECAHCNRVQTRAT